MELGDLPDHLKRECATRSPTTRAKFRRQARHDSCAEGRGFPAMPARPIKLTIQVAGDLRPFRHSNPAMDR